MTRSANHTQGHEWLLSVSTRSVTSAKKIPTAIAISIILASCLVSPVKAIETVEKSITVRGTPAQIVEAIVKHRSSEPEKRKIVSTSKSGVVIKEQMNGSMSLASDTLVYEETVRSDNRVEYHLLDAQKLTRFQGSWDLTESTPGYTLIKLTTSVDSWLNVPFKGRYLRNETSKQMDKRLAYVKQQIEKL